MLTDIQIAQQNALAPISEIAEKIGFNVDDIDLYGKYKAKVPAKTLEKIESNENGKLILVTAINPTPAGEGKSTTTVGLGDALSQRGKSTMIALREPSLGPTMGVKGGAAGGGYAQIQPMEDINLHFTGDMHAITTANNTLSALIDNHIHQGNELAIDVRRVTWKRAVDLNDRALREVTVALGGIGNGFPRQDGFDITVASEIMAILCLATDLEDMRARFARIVIGENRDRQPITVADLGAEGALTLVMKDAIAPNLVQTLEHTPAFVHGGPFANIAHGCNSVVATHAALKLADYVVTEAGFGADLGAEKFMDIKVPVLGKAPDAVVIVATIRSLKMHGGVLVKDLNEGENVEAVTAGFANLQKHIETMQNFQVPVVVCVNEFVTDTEAEEQVVLDKCAELGVVCVKSSVWADGGQGGLDLADAVVTAIEGNDQEFKATYAYEETNLEEKARAIVQKVYGGRDVVFSKKAQNQMRRFEKNGWGNLPICMAKTQYSLSDDPKSLGRPEDFDVTVRELVPKIGAGFIVALTGDVLTMPGLPKHPAALDMDIKKDGEITGLF
ncbi:formate--tetrahydrofolate ligase [Aerococcus viridans]|uniref:Formate--tetrahydrofolate ligase n=2 Tax=Aerococcus viridans TaxID=1377 RepID=A0AAU8U543_9LACT|nr:formate--tetrahydrofolate ligase [Aerococcus viridans]AMC01246.1 formate--tetrahydrofolate ligase [Aerococcus viridans]EFG50262.1 formate--tetrahydrofolate ligase [Aerococcus viridans ATCC 11563 = CCUG 4311]MEC1386208.1 formate--tetrahydrofolate ligase [Aerococcus viridans]SUU16636.1 Formate--tetrahydrofolate ligase 1 [Aerococcus viridans]